MKITFWGAAREVTGSRHLIETDRARLLLDCGMFQGRREESLAKNRHFGFEPDRLDAGKVRARRDGRTRAVGRQELVHLARRRAVRPQRERHDDAIAGERVRHEVHDSVDRRGERRAADRVDRELSETNRGRVQSRCGRCAR